MGCGSNVCFLSSQLVRLPILSLLADSISSLVFLFGSACILTPWGIPTHKNTAIERNLFIVLCFFFLHVEHNVSWKPHKESFVFVHWIPSSDLTEQSEKPTWAVMILEKSMRIFCTCCLCFISALSCPHSPHRGSYADAGIKTPRAVMAQIKADRLRRSHYATLCISCLSLYGL